MQANVAVVDDEKDLREAIGEYLTGMGLNAFPVAGAEELNALLDRETIDVVVLDIAMPGQNGLAIARSLRAGGRRPGNHLRKRGRHCDRPRGRAGDRGRRLSGQAVRIARTPGSDQVHPAAPAGRASGGASGTRHPAPRRVKVGRLSFDLDSRTLDSAEGGRIELTAMEGDLLATFAERPRRVLSRSHCSNLPADAPARKANAASISASRGCVARSSRTSITRSDPHRAGEGYVFDPDGSWS